MTGLLRLTGVAALVAAGVGMPVEAPARTEASAATRHTAFAPPLGERLDYRVTSRRLGSDGELIEFILHYELVWTALGRGLGLDATLVRIASDAPPPLRRAMTGLMEPLVGLPVRYLVSADGSRIDPVDPDDIWTRAAARAARLGQATPQGEANAMAAVLMALPLAERNQLLTADVRAVVAPANPAIPRADGPATPGVTASIRRQGQRTLVARSDRRTTLSAGQAAGALPLTSESTWVIDDRTGLVVGQTVQNWLKPGAEDAPTLVEEIVRTLILTPAV